MLISRWELNLYRLILIFSGHNQILGKFPQCKFRVCHHKLVDTTNLTQAYIWLRHISGCGISLISAYINIGCPPSSSPPALTKVIPQSAMAVRHLLSLNSNDFYPLTHIHAKYMTYNEKVAYHAKHGIPDTINKWFTDGKTCSKAPTVDPHQGGLSLESLFWQDVVECIFNIICKKVGIWCDLSKHCQAYYSSGTCQRWPSRPQWIHVNTLSSCPSDHWLLDVLLAESYSGYWPIYRRYLWQILTWMARNHTNRAPVLAESHSHVGDDA